MAKLLVKCIILLVENVLDRHVGNHGDSTAIIWEKDEPGDNEFVTYKYVHHMTSHDVR
jgi:acyl-coenzyme A synthetase/AMP-(fatty) acid ligase